MFSVQVHHLSSLDLDSLAPTPGTINKKAKSRLIDKDGRNRNRLSHTSAPLYFAKSKRPVPTDLEGAGATNRLPGGQQPVPRRQRSLYSKGESTNTNFCLSATNSRRSRCIVSFGRRVVRSVADESTDLGDEQRSPSKGLRNTHKLQVPLGFFLLFITSLSDHIQTQV